MSVKHADERESSKQCHNDGFIIDKVKTSSSILHCPIAGGNREQAVNDLLHVESEGHTLHITFPMNEEDSRSSTPIDVSVGVMDRQVIHMTSRSLANSTRKQKVMEMNASIEDDISCSIGTKKMCQSKSHEYVTTVEKACIYSHEISNDRDYLLAEGVLCEDILPSADMLPEEQILTIPSPSPGEFNSDTKPDVLAIAASEVFSDNCITLPLQGNKCVSDLMECQISSPKVNMCSSNAIDENIPCGFVSEESSVNNAMEETIPCRFSSDSSMKQHENTSLSHFACGSVQIAENEERVSKDSVYSSERDHAVCIKERFRTECESKHRVYHNRNYDSGRNEPCNLHVNPPCANSEITNVLPITSVDQKHPDITTQEDDCPTNTPDDLTSSTMENPSPKDDQDEIGSKERMPPGDGSLRRSSRISKCKMDPDFIGSDGSVEAKTCKKRRAGRGLLKKSALWDCVKCDAMFRTRASRNRHMQEGHLFRCFICNWQGLTKIQYEVHISTTHCSLKARCLLCRKDYPNFVEYRKHMETVHPDATDRQPKADGHLDGRSNLKTDNFEEQLSEAEGDVDDPNHDANGKHSIDDVGGKLESDKLAERLQGSEEWQEESSSVCPYCHKSFGRHSHFIRHLNYHVGNRPFMCNICGKWFVEKHALRVHLKSHSPINAPCSKCGKVLKTYRSLKQHLRTHANHLYQCPSCPKLFRSRESLRVHKTIHKEGGSGNVCTYCSKDYKTPYYLRLHVANKHEASKYFCEMCQRSFKWKGSYRRHMLTHTENSSRVEETKPATTQTKVEGLRLKPTEERKYSCDVCGKQFRHEFTRDKHARIVHQEERKHMCPHCGALFKAKGYLDQHLSQVHTTKDRVKCQTCGHDFKTEAILRNHIKLVHNSSEGKYGCEVCKKTFTAPKDLARHSKVHTGEKNHVCPICKRSFSRKDNMTSHLRTHSKNNAQAPVIALENNNVEAPKQQSSTHDSIQIMDLVPVEPPPCSAVPSSNFQTVTTPSTNIMDSVTSLVSGSIALSSLPLSSMSIPTSNSTNSESSCSQVSASSACIVFSSKHSSSTVPIVVFSGSGISSNHVLSGGHPVLNTISLSNIHSSLNDFPIIPPSTSSSLSSVTTLTYSNSNVPLPLSSTSHLYPASSSAPLALSPMAPVPCDSQGTCIENVQNPSVFSPSLHTEQIVLSEDVLTSTSISSQP